MDELITYIANSRKEGFTDEQIMNNLHQAGWQQEMINKVLHAEHPIPLPPSPPIIVKNNDHNGTSAWDAFEHILMFISLYVMSTSIALILHYFVDKLMPGIRLQSYITSSYLAESQQNFVRGYLAALIVSFPLFCFFFLSITKRTLANANIRKLKARKILIYITLVATFIIMLTSIISAVYNLLNGNVTINFILHLIVTLFVAGFIFAYYLYQVQDDRKTYA